MQQPFFERRGYGLGVMAGLCAALVLWAMARGLLVHVPLYDELLHFLSAQGLRERGELAIANGEYTRAWLYTYLVSYSFALFGETLVAARIPALLGALCLVAAVAVWVTRRAGVLAGGIAAGCLGLVPATVDLAVFARFYTVHALVILAMAIALFAALEPGAKRSTRLRFLGLTLILLPLAMHLQDSTVVAAGALTCGVAGVLAMDHWVWVRGFVLRHPWQVMIGAALAAGLGLVAVNAMGLLVQMQQVPLWNAWAVGRPHYYLMALAAEIPLLWPLFPVAMVFALVVQPRLALFCGLVLLSGLAVHSIAGQKAIRYIYYLLPFFCVVWGCALAGAAFLVRSAWERSQFRWHGHAELAVLALAALVLIGSEEGQAAAKMLAGRAKPADALGLTTLAEPEWQPIVPVLQPLLTKADRVVTSNAMKSLYYFGRYDYELNASIVPETLTQEEFGVDQRTGKQAIGAADSIQRVLAAPGATLVVLEDEKIDLDAGVSRDSMQVIEASCTPVELPPDTGVHAWFCQRQ